jgi:hypothetical protein
VPERGQDQVAGVDERPIQVEEHGLEAHGCDASLGG